jgi:hypothetical protein
MSRTRFCTIRALPELVWSWAAATAPRCPWPTAFKGSTPILRLGRGAAMWQAVSDCALAIDIPEKPPDDLNEDNPLERNTEKTAPDPRLVFLDRSICRREKCKAAIGHSPADPHATLRNIGVSG